MYALSVWTVVCFVVIVYTGIASVTRKRDTVKSDSKLETAVLPTPQASSLYLFYYVDPLFTPILSLLGTSEDVWKTFEMQSRDG